MKEAERVVTRLFIDWEAPFPLYEMAGFHGHIKVPFVDHAAIADIECKLDMVPALSPELFYKACKPPP